MKTSVQRLQAIARWQKENPEKVARYIFSTRLRKYGVTPEQYQQALERQEYKCAICKADVSRKDGSDFHIDHNHQTGKFRGLLCNNCNLGIGFLKDNPQILERAIQYLA